MILVGCSSVLLIIVLLSVAPYPVLGVFFLITPMLLVVGAPLLLIPQYFESLIYLLELLIEPSNLFLGLCSIRMVFFD